MFYKFSLFFFTEKKIITKNINFNSFAKKTPHTNKCFHLIFPNNCKLTFGAPSAFLAFPAPSDVLVKQPVKMFNVQQKSLFSFILSKNSKHEIHNIRSYTTRRRWLRYFPIWAKKSNAKVVLFSGAPVRFIGDSALSKTL